MKSELSTAPGERKETGKPSTLEKARTPTAGWEERKGGEKEQKGDVDQLLCFA